MSRAWFSVIWRLIMPPVGLAVPEKFQARKLAEPVARLGGMPL